MSEACHLRVKRRHGDPMAVKLKGTVEPYHQPAFGKPEAQNG